MQRDAAERWEILQVLIRVDTYKYFLHPIDPEAMGIPTYPQVIQQPICLTDIVNAFPTLTETQFFERIKRVYTNAIRFNSPSTDVHQCARKRYEWLVAEIVKYNQRREDDAERLRHNERLHRAKLREEAIQRASAIEARKNILTFHQKRTLARRMSELSITQTAELEQLLLDRKEHKAMKISPDGTELDIDMNEIKNETLLEIKKRYALVL